MTKIISLSLTDDLLRTLDGLEKELGFSGRSDAVRAGIRLLADERRRLGNLRGTVDAALLVVHEDEHAEDISHVRHAHKDIITTQLHNHLESHKCCELFMLHGPAARVRALVDELRASRKAEQVTLVPL